MSDKDAQYLTIVELKERIRKLETDLATALTMKGALLRELDQLKHKK